MVMIYSLPPTGKMETVPNSFPPQQPSTPGEIDFQQWYGPWATVRPEDVADILGDFDAPWWISGGWALDAFTGTGRAHDDVDVAIFRTALPALRRATADRLHLWSAGSGALRPLNDTFPDPHPDSDQAWVRANALSPWLLDILLTPDRDGDWVNRRDPTFSAPLDQVTWIAPDGIRYLAPELILIFKAKLARPKDRTDLERTWPLLTTPQQATLLTHLEQHHPTHDWLTYCRTT